LLCLLFPVKNTTPKQKGTPQIFITIKYLDIVSLFKNYKDKCRADAETGSGPGQGRV
jgi:hypothetical protein